MMGEGFGHGFGAIWMALIWVAPLVVVILGVLLFRRRGRDGRSALELLDEDYARGRIGRDEYLRRREDLEGR